MGLSELFLKAQAKGGIVMDETYIKMCKEAGEIQELWKPEYGDRYYYEPTSGFKGFDDIYSVYTDEVRGLGKDDIWLPRQEDLQEIERNCMQKKLKYITQRTLQQYERFDGWLRCQSFEGLDPNLDLTMLWLMFVMETVFSKCWNSKTESWEVIEP